jgi:type IX secretion system PorP/SprF family membrane protein
MKKAFFTLFFGLLVAAAAFAQEQAVYSQYQNFPLLVNPGATGFNNEHQFLLNARSSWQGFPAKPATFTAMYGGPVSDKLALGAGLYSDKAGDMNTLRFQLNYAFRFQINRTRVGIGLSTEFLNKHVDNSLLSNPLVDPNDPTLEGMIQSQRLFDASVWTSILYDDRLFVNLSLPGTIRTRLDEVPADQESDDSGLFKHYMFQLGYIVNVPNQNFKLVPSITLRQIRNVPYQIDLNLQGRFLDEKLIAGLTYRHSNEGLLTFLLGSKYNQFSLFYSYDVFFGNFQQYNGGSHELTFGYSLARRAPAKPQQIDPNM